VGIAEVDADAGIDVVGETKPEVCVAGAVSTAIAAGDSVAPC
jgi:hypothetical protein